MTEKEEEARSFSKRNSSLMTEKEEKEEDYSIPIKNHSRG